MFLLGGEVSHGAIQVREPEDGVVAKAAISGWSRGDLTLADGGKVFGWEARSGEGDVAIEPCSTLRFGGVLKSIKDDCHLFGERGFFACEALGVDSEFTRDGINFESGIVGKAPLSG